SPERDAGSCFTDDSWITTKVRPWRGTAAATHLREAWRAMSPETSGLARAVRLSLLHAIAGPAVSLPAAAQQAPADEARTLDTVQVTGTRIRRAELEGQVPVHTVSRQDIERSGLTSIG